MKVIINIVLLFFILNKIYTQNSSKKIELGVPKTTVFLPNDYNGEAQNFDFIQDRKGVMFVANTVGFLEFNGIKWRSFKPDNDGVPLSFAKNSNHTIFTGGTGFIGYLDKNDKGETVFVSLKNKLPKDFQIGFIWDIFCINDIIYFRNDENILIYENDKIEIIKTPSKIQNLFKVNDEIFVNTKNGLFQLDNNEFRFLTGSEIIGKYNVRSIFSTKKGNIIITTLKNGLFRLRNKKTTQIKSTITTFLREQMIFTVSELNDGKIAFSTIKGGVLLTDRLFNPIYRISEKGGLSNNSSKKIKQDYQGNLWIGSDKGITKIKYPITTTFYNHNKDNLGTIEEITNHKSNIFLGSSSGTFKIKKISTLDLLTDNHYAEFIHLPKDEVDNFANISLGNQFLFGGHSSFHKYSNNKSTFLRAFSPRKFYKSIHYPNILFMGHSNGCEVLFLNDKKEIINIKNIIKLGEIRGIAEDNSKNLWLTTIAEGIYKITLNKDFEIKKTSKFGLKDGLPSLRDNLAYNITDNQVIFTTHKGIFKFDESTQKFIPDNRFGEKYSGGNDEFIYAFNFDKKENAWMHSFRKKVAIAAIKDSIGNYSLFEKPLLDIGKIQAYEIFSEPDKNVIWFGGSDGLARFDKKVYNKNKSNKFYAVISKVTTSKDSLLVNGHQFNNKKETKLSASFRDVRFEIGATDFTNLDEINFQYKLEGYDQIWSNWTKESFKIYTNLNYGNYIFKVRAKNSLDNISISDNFSFSINPYWYQTKWFKTIFIIIVIGFISYIASYFSKRKFVKKVHELKLIQKLEKEKNDAIVIEKEKGLKALIDAQEEERNKIARELHDGVVQQMGSIILKSRKLFSKKKLTNEKESQELLQSLENSNKDLRNISHQMMPRALKELGIIPALNDLLEGSLALLDIKYNIEHFNIEKRLPQKIEVTIYRITQELINNIIKHSKANEVSVQLFNTHDSIVLIVEDNGVGFSSQKSKKGIGLLNITSRLDMVNGNVNFEPSPKSGTLVTIKIPL